MKNNVTKLTKPDDREKGYLMEHRGMSRKTFLIYLLQFPLFGGIARYLYGFKPQHHYLLNKFSVAGFYY